LKEGRVDQQALVAKPSESDYLEQGRQFSTPAQIGIQDSDLQKEVNGRAMYKTTALYGLEHSNSGEVPRIVLTAGRPLMI